MFLSYIDLFLDDTNNFLTKISTLALDLHVPPSLFQQLIFKSTINPSPIVQPSVSLKV